MCESVCLIIYILSIYIRVNPKYVYVCMRVYIYIYTICIYTG